jgi:hypothetical protein
MNVSKRTWILFGVAILAILAAFASLYFEKEAEIKLLESIEPDAPVIKTPVKKVVKVEPVIEPEIKLESDGTEKTV